MTVAKSVDGLHSFQNATCSQLYLLLGKSLVPATCHILHYRPVVHLGRDKYRVVALLEVLHELNDALVVHELLSEEGLCLFCNTLFSWVALHRRLYNDICAI